MATRSTIALEFADGTVQQVYCHWDGYLENNGQILEKHYKDPFKLQRLIDLGAISSLGPEIGEKQDFDKRDTHNENWSLIYARDRGEDLTKNSYKDFQEYQREGQREEYNYILRNVNGVATWFVEFYGCDGEFLTMQDAFEFQHAKEAA
jgi:hypothetical protein